jgi:hypothetical protein
MKQRTQVRRRGAAGQQGQTPQTNDADERWHGEYLHHQTRQPHPYQEKPSARGIANVPGHPPCAASRNG